MSGVRAFAARERYVLGIGGLRFEASIPEGVTVVEEDLLYAPFLAPGGAPPAALEGETVPVETILGGVPDVGRLPLVFDTGETWTAHQDGADVVMRLRGPGGADSALWTARLSAAGPIEVHCGERLIEDGGRRLINPLHYPLDQLLTMWTLAGRGLVIHAGGVVLDGRGLFLAGRSGTGKTTFLRLLDGGGHDLAGLSDDRVVARRPAGAVDGGLELHGTPWAGEGRVVSTRRVPLAAAVFLHQASRNEWRSIGPSAALAQLLPVASIPFFDASRRDAALAFAGELLATVPAFELHFRPEASALGLLERILGECGA